MNVRRRGIEIDETINAVDHLKGDALPWNDDGADPAHIIRGRLALTLGIIFEFVKKLDKFFCENVMKTGIIRKILFLRRSRSNTPPRRHSRTPPRKHSRTPPDRRTRSRSPSYSTSR